MTSTPLTLAGFPMLLAQELQSLNPSVLDHLRIPVESDNALRVSLDGGGRLKRLSTAN